MKRYIQSKTIHSHQQGNCMQTVIASMLDIKVEDVPSIENLFFDKKELKNLHKYARNTYLEGRSKNRVSKKEQYKKDNYQRFIAEACYLWNRVFHIFVHSKGFNIRYLYPHKKDILKEYDINIWLKNKKNKDKFYTASGISPRGVNHIVIYQNGKLFHDPHPEGGGVIDIYEYKVFEKI